MSFLGINTDNAIEPRAVKEGEHKIRITGYIRKPDENGELQEVWEDKNGNKCFMPTFEIPKVRESKEFTCYLPLPNDNMSDKQKNDAEWKIKEFKACFGITENMTPKQTIGKEGWAMLSLRKSKERGEENGVEKFIPKK